jgi:hypothetical protein
MKKNSSRKARRLTAPAGVRKAEQDVSEKKGFKNINTNFPQERELADGFRGASWGPSSLMTGAFFEA